MSFQKTIQLFLLDATPNGRWICELSNWIGIAYKIPRNLVKESDARTELTSPGVYFLFGKDESKERPYIYIGEAENTIMRLKQHLKKDGWSEVIVFISKDSSLNKAHIKFLENKFYNLAVESDRYIVDNSTIPTKPTISEAEEAVLNEFAHNAKILMNTIGHKVFEPYFDKANNPVEDDKFFYLSVENGKATCVPTSEGFILLKGSTIHQTASASLSVGIKKQVEECRANGQITNNILQHDRPFTSSSAAAAFAAGYSISGPKQWKTASGKTLKSIEEVAP